MIALQNSTRMHAASLIILGLLVGACVAPNPQASSQSKPEPRVVLQGTTSGIEVVQSFEINNCDGKANAERTESRSRSVETTISTELAAVLGASVEVISAEIQATVGAAEKWGSTQEMTFHVTAPPGTRMAFQLAWIGDEEIGVVQNFRGTDIPIAFRSFSPTDVRIKSQIDIGCPVSPDDLSQTVYSQETSPTQPVQPMTAETCSGQIARQKVTEWAVTGEVSDPRTVENHLNQYFYGLKAGSWDFTDKDRIPAGVLVATDFGGRGETNIWRDYPLRPVVSYRSYGLFETTGDFQVPPGVTGQCLTISP